MANDQLARHGDADGHGNHPRRPLLRFPDFEEAQTQSLWLVLSCVAAVFVAFGAAYGGTLVFEYGFNVENVDEVWNVSETDHVRPERKKPSA